MVEKTHGTIRWRNKIRRGIDNEQTAQTVMDASRIYYNFLRPHIALRGKTLRTKAKIVDSTTTEIGSH